MIARLVAFDTTSVKSNLDLIEDVAGYLRDRGAAVICGPGAIAQAHQ
jgi:hypothetical protein